MTPPTAVAAAGSTATRSETEVGIYSVGDQVSYLGAKGNLQRAQVVSVLDQPRGYVGVLGYDTDQGGRYGHSVPVEALTFLGHGHYDPYVGSTT